ncbi:MAG: C-GCAxxG-C-C family protein [Desulfuromonadales bacterium]|nr:C-GCAxxG-C-C family protein [Desulfuromonadales bacterium]
MNLNKADEAVACFNDGFNCSQAIFSTYCDELGLDKETALKIACGLGGGMGGMQGTCGAVSGAYLLIGLKYGYFLKEDKAIKGKIYAVIRKFAALFEERNKTTSCRELLGVDFVNDDKQITMERIKTVCPKVIRDAAEIIEQMLFSDEAERINS